MDLLLGGDDALHIGDVFIHSEVGHMVVNWVRSSLLPSLPQSVSVMVFSVTEVSLSIGHFFVISQVGNEIVDWVALWHWLVAVRVG